MKRDDDKERVKEHRLSYGEKEPEDSFVEEERFEIIEGIRYELKPAPSVTHQRLLAGLHIMIYQTCHPNGVILFSPLERHGVKEYWVLDRVHLTLDQFILSGSKYELFETYGIKGRLSSPQFSCVDIDMSQLFAM